MDIPEEDYELAQALPPKPTLTLNPISVELPQLCTAVEAIQSILQNADDVATCLEWAKPKYGSFLTDVRIVENSRCTAEDIIQSWKISCASMAKWGNAEIPTLHRKTSITVGELHAYLSEILVAHPAFAAVPVHHEECRGNVETYSVEFLVEEGILVLS